MIVKSPQRIVKIATAKMRRATRTNWSAKWTRLWDELDPERKKYVEWKFKRKPEIGVLLFWVNDSNWTALTSHAVMGKNKGIWTRVEFKRILDSDFGNPGITEYRIRRLLLRTRWRTTAFQFESQSPGYMFMGGFRVIHVHWKYNAIKD